MDIKDKKNLLNQKPRCLISTILTLIRTFLLNLIRLNSTLVIRLLKVFIIQKDITPILGELGGGAGYDVQGDYGARFWSPTAFGGVENIDDLIAANQRYWEAAQASSRLTDYGTAWSKRNISEESAYARKWETGDMFELPGMSVQNRWEVDSDTGKMKRKPPESAFDALYEENGIDPNDPDMVEYFWGFANDALLQMGEFFDVIEWPSGGGYGGGYEEYPYPPYVTSSMPGQKPRRGDYDSYLSLTSWI